MRNISRWVTAIAALFIVSAPQGAKAGMVGMPRAALAPMIQHIVFDTPTLAPMAYTMFCLRYADQCKPQRMMFRGGPVRMTAERWNDLKEVNDLVSAAIVPERNFGGLAAEKLAHWTLKRRLCGYQAIRIARSRLAGPGAASERSCDRLGRASSGSGG
jgi:predicted transglutaminase-like cysteine proteinase